MSLKYYHNFLNNVKKTPSETYKDFQQAFVESQWDDTTLKCVVEEEIKHGSFKFEKIEVWKNSISEFTINISKNEQDYRRLQFADHTHMVERGRFYKFDNNYWITYDPISDFEAYREVYVRRCNNYLKWIDKDTGEIYSVPCVIDNEVGSPTPRYSKTIILPSGHVVIWVQGNEITKKIKKNQRFIFNGDAYKFVSYNAYMQSDIIDKDVPILYLDLYIDEIQPTDDVENCIANRGEVEYEVVPSQTEFVASKYDSGILNATVTFNGNLTDKEVRWYSLSDNILMDEYGNYEIVNDKDSQAVVRCFMLDNENIYKDALIKIQSEPIVNKRIIIEPYFTQIRQNDTIEFSVNLYNNNVKQDVEIIPTVKNLDETYYTLTNNGNNLFELKSNKISKEPLVIEFNGEDIMEKLEVELKSLF